MSFTESMERVRLLFHEAFMREMMRENLKICATSIYQHVLVGGDIPIRLKNQQPPKRRLADFL